MNVKTKYWIIEILKIIVEGILIGALIALYRYAAHYVVKFSTYVFTNPTPLKITLGIIGLIILGILSGFLIKFDGNIQGSGLPQLEMNIEHKSKTIRWYSIPLMFLNSLISFFAGLPVGSEGPSTFMGGVISLAANRVIKHEDKDDDIPIGMGIGFGVAMMSPLSGVLYSFEECLHSFKLEYIWKSILMMCFAFLTAYLINPSNTILLPVTTQFEWRFAWVFAFIVILNFIIGKLIIYLMPLIKGFINNHYKNFFFKNRFYFIYVNSAALMIFIPILMGSGSTLINEMSIDSFAYITLIMFLIIRIILFIFVGDSMASGGLMIPSLVIGAIVGEIANEILINCGCQTDMGNLLIIISMLSLFTVLNSTPLTSLILSISFAGYMNFLNIILPALIVISVSYLLVKLTKTVPLNTARKRLLRTSRSEKL